MAFKPAKIVWHQVSAGRSAPLSLPHSRRGFIVLQAEVMVPGMNREYAARGLEVSFGCSGRWDVQEQGMGPGVKIFKAIRDARGEKLVVPPLGHLWVTALWADTRGVARERRVVIDPLIVCNFKLKRVG